MSRRVREITNVRWINTGIAQTTVEDEEEDDDEE